MAVSITVTPIAVNGLANTGVAGVPVASIIQVRPANAGELSGFSTAVSAVDIRDVKYNQNSKTTFLCVATVAATITAMNA